MIVLARPERVVSQCQTHFVLAASGFAFVRFFGMGKRLLLRATRRIVALAADIGWPVWPYWLAAWLLCSYAQLVLPNGEKW